jgi:hypothetical protein
MHTTLKKKLTNRRNPFREQGLALLAVVFLLGLAATAYALRALNADEMKIEREKITIQALSDAKSGLISWAVSNSSQPGMLPYPDRNGDGNYDGDSDCSTVAFSYSFLIGKLPWRAADNAYCPTLVSGMGSDIKDGSEEPLWYVVSRNLVYDYPNTEYPVINPGMINSPNDATAPYQRQGGITAYPWLEVYDKKGQLLSNRVAVILIAPGAAIGDQDRSAAAPNATEYLDTFTLAAGGGAKSNRTYSAPDEDFYMGEDMSKILASDTLYNRPYEFNDKLIYITIDELMAEIQKRAAAEAKKALNKYYIAASGYFPHPASIGIGEYFGNESILEGFLPTQQTSQPAASCSVTYTSADASSAICDLSTITSVQFTRTTGTFTSTAGVGCTRLNANTTCQCTTSGRCNAAGGRRFECDSAGICATSGGTMPGTYTFQGVFTFASGTPPTIRPNVFNTPNGISCSGCGGNAITCSASENYPITAIFGYRPKPVSEVFSLADYFEVPSSTTNGSGNITTANNFNNVTVGMSVIGTGIPASTTVTSIPNSTTVALSNQATESSALTSIFFGTFGDLPSWFVTNRWRDYLYYAVSSNCVSGGANCSTAMPQLTVGTKTGVQALLIGSGNPIIAPFPFASKGSAQSHPSCNAVDYLDSAINTNLDSTFDKSSMPRGNSYNDQAIIVAP